MNKKLKISNRLCCVAGFVRDGAVLADIGTDHAYIPVFLAEGGKISRAIASDVAPGPVARAAENVRNYNMQNIISVRLGDGLSGLENEKLTDIVIAGMGGELIARIIDAAPFVREAGIRLILQPMTRPETLRGYLYKNGFAVIDETLVRDGRIYHVICAEYDAITRKATDFEMCMGLCNLQRREDPLVNEMLNRLKNRVSAAYYAKNAAGIDCTAEKKIIDEISEYEKNPKKAET